MGEPVALDHLNIAVWVVLCGIALILYNSLWVKPQRLWSKLSRQGIRGPSPLFLLGNVVEMRRMAAAKTSDDSDLDQDSHDWLSSLFPYFVQWLNQYGRNFVFWLGHSQVLYVADPYVAKELGVLTSSELGRPDFVQKTLGPLLGRGILTTDGPSWAHQRQIISPEFYMDNVKGRFHVIVEAASNMVRSWQTEIERQGGVGVINPDKDLTIFASSIISKTLFGKNHVRGTDLLLRFEHIVQAFAGQNWIKSFAWLWNVPTKSNRGKWRLEKEMKRTIQEMAKEGMDASDESGLLQKIIEGARWEGEQGGGAAAAEQFIVDNCKNVFLAGYASTSATLLWALVLLAQHPEWQDRGRAEVFQVCGDRDHGLIIPDFNVLGRMKVLTSIIHEVLRLYPTGYFLPVRTQQDLDLKKIQVPKGLTIWVSAIHLHRDPEIWGDDAQAFNPHRFFNGVTGACKVPQAYMPFGFGKHICLGQHLAMLELKVALSLILSNFSFSLSPNYTYSPVAEIQIRPKHGADLIFKTL